MTDPVYKYLMSLDSPADLRKLNVTELKTVAAEVREFIIDTISCGPPS